MKNSIALNNQSTSLTRIIHEVRNKGVMSAKLIKILLFCYEGYSDRPS